MEARRPKPEAQRSTPKAEDEVRCIVVQERDGGLVAISHNPDIVTRGDTWDDLVANVREAVAGYYFDGKRTRDVSIILDIAPRRSPESKAPFHVRWLAGLRRSRASASSRRRLRGRADFKLPVSNCQLAIVNTRHPSPVTP